MDNVLDDILKNMYRDDVEIFAIAAIRADAAQVQADLSAYIHNMKDGRQGHLRDTKEQVTTGVKGHTGKSLKAAMQQVSFYGYHQEGAKKIRWKN